MAWNFVEIIDGVHVDVTEQYRQQAAAQAAKVEPKSESQRLRDILLEHKSLFCGCCGHEIGFGDIAWNNGQTEYGTPYTMIEVQCEACQNEIAQISAWTEIESNDDLLDVLSDEWRWPAE